MWMESWWHDVDLTDLRQGVKLTRMLDPSSPFAASNEGAKKEVAPRGNQDLWAFLPEPCYEPERRNKDGVRWIRHRFAIRGGITLREVMIADMYRPGFGYLQEGFRK